MDTPYYHVHDVDLDICKGHMACMRPCPTQAIRVRNGKAKISGGLCVDCGLCVSICPSQAIVPTSDPITEISQFKYKVVIPSPVLYSQFEPDIHPYIIHLAFKELGFDQVVDVSGSTVALNRSIIQYMQEYEGRLPLISSHCPSVIRFIQVKYPDLVEQIIPFDVPREVTARETRQQLPSKLKMKPEDIGIVYISPCPAITVSIKQPAEKTKSWFDGVFSIKDVFTLLHPHVIAIKENFNPEVVPKDFSFYSGWATLGSLTRSAQMENWLAVSGVDQIAKIFDDIENSRLRNVDFVEALSCMLGCIGGSFNVENTYVARANLMKQKQEYIRFIEVDEEDIKKKLDERYYFMESTVRPRATAFFDTDLETSIKRMKERERIYNNLKQIDCGCCGSPTCMAFAEDVVKGEVELTDCIFLSENGRHTNKH